MIYIASPYSHDSSRVREHRFHLAMNYTAQLLHSRLIAFSPIVYAHRMAQLYDLPKDFEYWKEFNDHMMANAECVHLLQISGWKESAGIRYELDFAKLRSLPVIPVSISEVTNGQSL